MKDTILHNLLKIRNYIKRDFLDFCIFIRALIFWYPDLRSFDVNNAMINATGKNGVNHGISHDVKEPPNRVQSPFCSCLFLKIQTVLIQQEVVDTHDQHTRLIVIRCRCIFGNDHSLEEISRQH